MIGLVFGFFFAVCLLMFCLWVLELVLEEPTLLVYPAIGILLIYLYYA